MIRKVLMGTVALAALSTTAFAADLPSRRAPPVYVPPIPVFSWTGFYIGGQVGEAFGESRLARTGGTAALTGNNYSRPNGIIGGAHMGYNFSTQGLGFGGAGILGAGGLVIGIEGDIDGSDYRSTVGTASLRNQIQGSARGRLGLGVDRALFYVTGGAAFAQFQLGYGPAGAVAAQTASATRVGWTVGGGVEYAVTTQWSLRGEYRYSDFGTFRNALVSTGGPVAVSRREIQQKALVGFSYKFDTPVAPVVARY